MSERSGRWPRTFFMILGTYSKWAFFYFSLAQRILLLFFQCHTVTYGRDLRKSPHRSCFFAMMLTLSAVDNGRPCPQILMNFQKVSNNTYWSQMWHTAVPVTPEMFSFLGFLKDLVYYLYYVWVREGVRKAFNVMYLSQCPADIRFWPISGKCKLI